ncbi:MAG: hypothetical protein MJZ67_01020 [Bacteroidales bacterium]|nr:hypothetical protein [Bacteroidales bacterium]
MLHRLEIDCKITNFFASTKMRWAITSDKGQNTVIFMGLGDGFEAGKADVAR